MLLPKIYQKVRLASGPRISSFLEVAPAYGKFCQELTLQIPRTGPITELCCANLRYMVGLKKLVLDIWEEKPLREFASSDLAFREDMNAMEIRSLKSVFQFLPTSITSLQICGITWSDLAKAISTTQFPRVHTLDLWLHYGSQFPTETADVFNSAFPCLIDFTVEDHWALTVPWVAKAFFGRHLERIAIVKYRLRWPVFPETPTSEWVTSVDGLIMFNSFTLTTLMFDTAVASSLRFPSGYMPLLHSFTLANVDFEDDADGFFQLLRPTFRYPLRQLILKDCHHVPELFATWFDPASKSDIWPHLQSLSVATILSSLGPGDDLWDEATEEERDSWDSPDDISDIWSSSGRWALYENCNKRNITFDLEDFRMWEGWG